MELDELETPCADDECQHTLKDHLNGAGPWDWCQACVDCPNFITVDDCASCHAKGTFYYDNGNEVACPTCGGSGNA